MAKRSGHNRVSFFGNLLILIFAVVGLWLIGLVKFDGEIPRSVEAGNRPVQAIVVLTGGSGRLDEGLDLLAKHPQALLFVSGVYKGNEVRHLLTLSKQRPVALGSRIDIGNAVDTRENAEETADWIIDRGVSSFLLVTAAYHMPRSLLEFSHKVPEVTIIPHPVFPSHVKQDKWWAYPGTTALVIGEYNKFLLAWCRQKLESVSGGEMDWTRLKFLLFGDD